MKKHNKKNTRKNNHYNGRNIFGDRCVAKTLKLEKETAFDQCVQMLKEVMTSEVRIEYTLDWTAMTEDEAIAIQDKLNRLLELRGMYA